MYQVRILDSAAHELAGLEKTIARNIVKRIHWLSENLDNLRLEALSGDFAGLYKLRVGDYRVVYELISAEQTIIIHTIGHRREIYRKR